METISFASLFLGLVVGVHPVQIAVTAPVASVELRLDGRAITTLHGPPWVFQCDFGEALRPHRLEGFGFDTGGNALGHCRQWVNMPRGSAEAEIVLERNETGTPVLARVTWDSLEF